LSTPATSRLPALTLWRPWPHLILHHGKNVENRHWQTRRRGPVILHAARKIDVDVTDHYSRDEADRTTLLAEGLVGVVTITGIHPASQCRSHCSSWAQPSAAFHWELTDPRPFPTPIPGPGRQRLFRPPADAIAAADAVLSKPA
jgi:hypothetical protein